jgi:hypothetical protein
MEFKGTKGKWSFHQSRKGKTIKIDGYNWIGFAKVYYLKSGNSVEETQANALLISKALALLENAQMHIDSLDLTNMEFYNKYGFNVAEITEKTRQLIIESTKI